MAKPPVFNGEAGNGGFITTCRLYLRMKIRGIICYELKTLEWIKRKNLV